MRIYVSTIQNQRRLTVPAVSGFKTFGMKVTHEIQLLQPDFLIPFVQMMGQSKQICYYVTKRTPVLFWMEFYILSWSREWRYYSFPVTKIDLKRPTGVVTFVQFCQIHSLLPQNKTEVNCHLSYFPSFLDNLCSSVPCLHNRSIYPATMSIGEYVLFFVLHFLKSNFKSNDVNYMH